MRENKCLDQGTKLFHEEDEAWGKYPILCSCRVSRDNRPCSMVTRSYRHPLTVASRLPGEEEVYMQLSTLPNSRPCERFIYIMRLTGFLLSRLYIVIAIVVKNRIRRGRGTQEGTQK